MCQFCCATQSITSSVFDLANRLWTLECRSFHIILSYVSLVLVALNKSLRSEQLVLETNKHNTSVCVSCVQICGSTAYKREIIINQSCFVVGCLICHSLGMFIPGGPICHTQRPHANKLPHSQTKAISFCIRTAD